MDQLAHYGAAAIGALVLAKFIYLAWLSWRGRLPEPGDEDYSGWG